MPLLFGLGGAAVLVTLGLWQLDRLDWKRGLIAEAGAMLAADPVPLPAKPDPDADRYRRVTATGTITGVEAHVLTSDPPHGVGFKVISAFVTDDGRRILIDRGFVPEADKLAPRPEAKATIAGSLMWPRETDFFTPDADKALNLWFARDVVAMSKALATEPVLVVLSEPAGEGAPRPLPVTANFRNDHRQYAITWFSLAVVWLGMTVYWILRIRRNQG